MQARICEIKYVPGESFIETGFKRGQYPSAPTCHGGNGTYRVCYPSDIEVVMDVNGRRLTCSIGRDVRRFANRQRLTQSFVERIRNASPNLVDVENCEGYWKIREDCLDNWISRA